MIYNIGFLFKDEKFNSYLKKLSQKYGENIDSKYILGINSLPHITVLQVEGEKENILKTLKSEKLLNYRFTLSLSNFHCIKSADNSVWYELQINPTKELIDFQQRIYFALGKPNIKNKIGENYRPHITLGFIEKDSPKLTYLLQENLEYSSIEGFLSLGISGPEFQFEEEIQ